MYTIHSISLKNIVYFKEVKLRLDKNALTFCMGENLDSDPANPTGNGAGKSLLFSCLPNLFYFSPPSANRKNSKKELLKAGSVNIVRFSTPNEIEYEVHQTQKGYKIIENGTDLEFGRIPDAEKFIRSIFPLSEIDYYSYCYVSTQRPYLFQTDTDLNRLDYLTQVFRLNSYDIIRQHFQKLLSDVKSNETRLSLLEQKSVEITQRLKKVEKQKEGMPNKDVLKKSLDNLKIEQDSLLEITNKNELFISDLRTLLKVEKELDILRKKYKYKEPPSSFYDKLLLERKVVRKLETYKEQRSTYLKTVNSIKSKLDSLEKPVRTLKSLDKLIEKVNASITVERKEFDKLTAKRSEYLKQKTVVEKLIDKRKDLKVGDLDGSIDYNLELSQCLSTLKLEELLDHEDFNEHDSSCPVCLSTIDIDNIKKLVKKAKEDEPRLRKATKAQELDKELAKARKVFESIEFSKKSLDNVVLKLDSLHAENEEHYKEKRKVASYNDLKEQLDSIEKPVDPKVTPTLGMSLDEIDTYIQLCSDIFKHLEVKSHLVASNPTLVKFKTADVVKQALDIEEKTLSTKRSRLKKLRSKMEILYEEIESIIVVQTEYERSKKDQRKIRKEIDDLLPSIKDKQALEVLIKAYSSKGLKTIVANDICSLLETNLNFYSNLVFAEPFVFSIKVSESGMSILVDRSNGVVSDVRNLSGAESNSFRLLFLLSLLVLIPSDRRLNMLVLDEPSSHQDEVSRSIFLEKYLPVIQEVVNNIYIITPNYSDIVKGSSVLVVKKENGVSSLRKNVK